MSDDYGTKVAFGRHWTRSLRSGDHVFVGSAAGEPRALIDSLIGDDEQDLSPDSLTVHQLPQGGEMRLVASARPERRLIAIAGNGDIAQLAHSGAGTYRLSTIGQTAAAIRRGQITFDVALIQVSPPDSDGRCSLGIAVDFALDAVEHARLVVAQVNSRMPYTHGRSLIPLDKITAIVERDDHLRAHPVPAPDQRAEAIAQHVAALVPNGATIEIGVGAVPTAILAALAGHQDLGLHTGLFVEPMVPLIQNGTITNRYGTLPGHVSVANQATADDVVTAFLDDNHQVAMMPASYTHDPFVLRSLARMRAINGAVEVDLLGRVNSEFIDGRRLTTAGGLLDFVRAANDNEDGRSIIAVRSATASGSRSKIVPTLSSIGSCTIEADLADLVVTEHGIADLSNQPVDERIRRMIAVADPAHRESLSEQARLLYG